MADDLEKIVPVIDGVSDALRNAAQKLDELRGKVYGVETATTKLTKVEKQLKEAVTALVQAQDKGIKNTKALQDTVRKLEGEYTNLTKEAKEVDKQFKEFTKTLEEGKSGLEKWRDSCGKVEKTASDLAGMVNKLHSGFTGLANSAISFGKVFGAQAVTYDVITKSMLEYNKGIFNLSRVQSTFGQSSNNVTKALQSIKANTILSQNQFLGLAKSFSDVYVGIKPTSQEMADMASMMQRSFGPSLEAVTKGMNTLAAVQNKLPMVYDKIRQAQEKLKGPDTEENRKGVEALQAEVLSLMRASGASRDQQQDVYQMMQRQTKESKTAYSASERAAKAEQSVQDAMLAMGKSVQEALLRVADTTSAVYNQMEKMPKAALGVAGAFAAWEIGSSVVKNMWSLVKGVGELAHAAPLFKALRMDMKGLGGSIPNVPSGAGGAGETPSGSVIGNTGRGGAGLVTKVFVAGMAFSAGASIGTAINENVSFDSKDLFGTSFGGMGISNKRQDENQAALQLVASKDAAVKKGAIDTYGEGDFREEYSKQSKSDPGLKSAIKAGDAGAIEKKQRDLINKTVEALAAKVAVVNKKETERKKTLENIYGQYGKTIRSSAELAAATGPYLTNLVQVTAELDRQDTNMEALVGFYNKLTDLSQKRLDISTKLGMVDQQSADEAAVNAKQSLAEIEKGLKGGIGNLEFDQLGKNLESAIKGVDMTKVKLVDPKSIQDGVDGLGQVKDMLNQIISATVVGTEGEKAKNIFIGQRTKIEERILNYQNALATNAEKQNQQATRGADIAGKWNTLLAQRAELQNKVASSAMLGFGASVQMMQKQVNIAYDQIKAENIAIANISKINDGYKMINSTQAATLDGMSTFTEQQAYAKKLAVELKLTGKDEEKFIANINTGLQERLQRENKIYEQQLKIYELTKDIREGYLDAMREMSSGAKEFDKIIGNRNKGVTQMMDAIRKTEGKYALNTQTMGGQGQRGMLDPSRMNPAATFGGAGMTYDRTGKEQKDLYNYQDAAPNKEGSQVRTFMESNVWMKPMQEAGNASIAASKEMNNAANTIKEGGNAIKEAASINLAANSGQGNIKGSIPRADVTGGGAGQASAVGAGVPVSGPTTVQITTGTPAGSATATARQQGGYVVKESQAKKHKDLLEALGADTFKGGVQGKDSIPLMMGKKKYMVAPGEALLTGGAADYGPILNKMDGGWVGMAGGGKLSGDAHRQHMRNRKAPGSAYAINRERWRKISPEEKEANAAFIAEARAEAAAREREESTPFNNEKFQGALYSDFAPEKRIVKRREGTGIRSSAFTMNGAKPDYATRDITRAYIDNTYSVSSGRIAGQTGIKGFGSSESFGNKPKGIFGKFASGTGYNMDYGAGEGVGGQVAKRKKDMFDAAMIRKDLESRPETPITTAGDARFTPGSVSGIKLANGGEVKPSSLDYVSAQKRPSIEMPSGGSGGSGKQDVNVTVKVEAADGLKASVEQMKGYNKSLSAV